MDTDDKLTDEGMAGEGFWKRWGDILILIPYPFLLFGATIPAITFLSDRNAEEFFIVVPAVYFFLFLTALIFFYLSRRPSRVVRIVTVLSFLVLITMMILFIVPTLFVEMGETSPPYGGCYDNMRTINSAIMVLTRFR